MRAQVVDRLLKVQVSKIQSTILPGRLRSHLFRNLKCKSTVSKTQTQTPKEKGARRKEKTQRNNKFDDRRWSIMTTGLVNTDGLLQIIATNARRRRFERQRMKYIRPTDDGDFRNGGTDPCLKNSRRRATREGTSSEDTSSTRKKSKLDDGKMISDLTPFASSSSSETSSDKEGNPVRMLVSGGEFSGETDSRSVTCLSHGSISVIGRRRAMEDTLMVAPGILAGDFTSYDFFAVYDGHGGVSVAQACRDRLHQLLANEVEGWTRGSNDHEGGGGRGIDWEKVMVSCFKQMDDEVNVGGGGGVEAPGVSTVGSTAVVVMVGKEELVVANCGDSRAVLCRGGIAVPLSRDHKPDRPDERERVEALGGKIIDWNGCRVLGVLATSRSIGDQYLKPYVISEPEVTVSVRTESDNFLIIATDGLWDVLSNEAACEVVRRCLVGLVRRRFIDDQMNGSYSMEAAAMLAELAMARGSKDNISVIVVELKKSPGSVS